MFSHKKKLCKPTTVIDNRCIYSFLICDSVSCFEVFDPVCGCDDINYCNSCYVPFSGSVRSYFVGEYPDYFFR